MKLCILGGLLGLAAISLQGATNLPKTGLAGSTHDIKDGTGVSQGCKSCHAPHNGALANGGPQTTGAILMWSQKFSAVTTFGTYQSATMTSQPVDLGLGGAPTGTGDVRMYSLLCLSCHDGVTSTFTPAMKPQNMVGLPGQSLTGLGNDHPINMNYDNRANPSLQDPSVVQQSLPLFTPPGSPAGTLGTVQCATCHDPHNNVNTNYLRQANTAAHCTTCHL